MARAHDEDRLTVDAAHMLAIIAPTPEAQDAWHASALALAESSPDPAARRERLRGLAQAAAPERKP